MTDELKVSSPMRKPPVELPRMAVSTSRFWIMLLMKLVTSRKLALPILPDESTTKTRSPDWVQAELERNIYVYETISAPHWKDDQNNFIVVCAPMQRRRWRTNGIMRTNCSNNSRCDSAPFIIELSCLQHAVPKMQLTIILFSKYLKVKITDVYGAATIGTNVLDDLSTYNSCSKS